MLAALAAGGSGWVTQSQAKYGAQPKTIADSFRGIGLGYRAASYSSLGYFWHQPEQSSDNRGLGGGINWAVDDVLCYGSWASAEQEAFFDGKGSRRRDGRLVSQFSEDLFFANLEYKLVRCKDMRAALHRAFSTWSAVHPDISFVDVTEECRVLHGHVRSNCSLVEVFITARTGDGIGPLDGKPWPYGGAEYVDNEVQELSSPQALVGSGYDIPGRRRSQEIGSVLETSDNVKAYKGTAASALQYARWATDLRSTNGAIQYRSCRTRQRQRGDGFTTAECDEGGLNPGDFEAIEVYGGHVSFNIEQCWYLDSAFCANLHGFKRKVGTETARAVIMGLCWTGFALGFLYFAWCIRSVFEYDHFQDETNKCRAYGEIVASWGVLHMTIMLLSLITPIAVHYSIVVPCWDCHDFEAAATHEIGHILGLHHPNDLPPLPGFPPGNNSYSTRLAAHDGIQRFDAADQPADLCENPWPYVEAGAWPNASDLTVEGVRNSIMEALTEHNPKVCLQPDDIEGLYMLYPRCDGRGLSTSTEEQLNCFKLETRIGLVLVLAYVLTPVILILLLLMMILHCVTKIEENVKEELKEEAREALQDKETALEEAKVANEEAKAAAEKEAVAEEEASAAKRVAHGARRKSIALQLKAAALEEKLNNQIAQMDIVQNAVEQQAEARARELMEKDLKKLERADARTSSKYAKSADSGHSLASSRLSIAEASQASARHSTAEAKLSRSKIHSRWASNKASSDVSAESRAVTEGSRIARSASHAAVSRSISRSVCSDGSRPPSQPKSSARRHYVKPKYFGQSAQRDSRQSTRWSLPRQDTNTARFSEVSHPSSPPKERLRAATLAVGVSRGFATSQRRLEVPGRSCPPTAAGAHFSGRSASNPHLVVKQTSRESVATATSAPVFDEPAVHSFKRPALLQSSSSGLKHPPLSVSGRERALERARAASAPSAGGI